MKIVDLKLSDPVYIPARQMADAINVIHSTRDHTFLHVYTDEGITGIGPARGGNLHRILVEELLKPCVIGEDPLNSERIWRRIY